MLNKVAFKGASELEAFQQAIKKQSPALFLNGVRKGEHLGLNAADISSKTFKQALLNARELNPAAAEIYDVAEFQLKRGVKEKMKPAPLWYMLMKKAGRVLENSNKFPIIRKQFSKI